MPLDLPIKAMPRLLNFRLASFNIARVWLYRGTKWTRHVVHELTKEKKRIRSLSHAARNIFLQYARRATRMHKPFIRWRRRALRDREQVAHYRGARRVERRIKRMAKTGSSPMVIGPWTSEVGYEVLYWIPFLRWMKDRYFLTSEDLVVVSRGGVSDWYRDISSTYIEILDLIDPITFANRYSDSGSGENESQKQWMMSSLDREVIREVKNRLDVNSVRVCHPSFMYQLFKQFWLGNLAFDFLMQHVQFSRQHVNASKVRESLPDEYVAVKFYSGQALPETLWCEQVLHSMVKRIAAQVPVVVMEMELAVDEHRDFDFSDIPGVTVTRLPVKNNLGLQTEIIGRSQAFVGTCGGLAWLAPMLGIETVAVFADDRHLKSHLFVARHAFRQLKSTFFETIDLRAVERFHLFDSKEDKTTKRGRHRIPFDGRGTEASTSQH